MKQALLIFVLLGTSVYSQSVQNNNEEEDRPKALEQPEPRTFSRQVTQGYTEEEERARVLFQKFTQPSIQRNDDRLIPNPKFPRNCASGHLRVFTGHESWQNQR